MSLLALRRSRLCDEATQQLNSQEPQSCETAMAPKIRRRWSCPGIFSSGLMSNTDCVHDVQLQEKVTFTLHGMGGDVVLEVVLEENEEDSRLAPILMDCLLKPWHGVLTPSLKILGLSTSVSLRELARTEKITHIVCTRVSIPTERVADELISASLEVIPLARCIFQSLEELRDPRVVAWSLHQLTQLNDQAVCDVWLECLEILAKDRSEHPQLPYLDPVKPFLQDLERAFRFRRCNSDRPLRAIVVSETGRTLQLKYSAGSLQAWKKACFPCAGKRHQVKELLRKIIDGLVLDLTGYTRKLRSQTIGENWDKLWLAYETPQARQYRAEYRAFRRHALNDVTVTAML